MQSCKIQQTVPSTAFSQCFLGKKDTSIKKSVCKNNWVFLIPVYPCLGNAVELSFWVSKNSD